MRPDTDDLIAFLNSIAKIDNALMEAMVNTRFPCVAALRDHPSVQVIGAEEGGTPTDLCGILGLLSGYCGTIGGDGPMAEWGPICALTENGVISFVRTDRYKAQCDTKNATAMAMLAGYKQ